MSKAKKIKTIKDLLEQVSHQELKDFVLQYVKKNKNFKSDLEVYFATYDEDFDIDIFFRQQIKKTIKSHSKWGYIEYSSGIKLVKDLDLLFRQSQQLLNQGNLRDACISSLIFLQETIDIISICDDSHGYIGELLDNVVSFIEHIISISPLPLKEKVCDIIINELKRSVYFEYSDIGYDLLGWYSDLCFELGRVEELTEYVESLLKKSKKDDDTFSMSFIITLLINIYTKTGKIDQAQKLLKSNMKLPEIRQAIVFQKIENKEYEEAKQLIIEGIDIAVKLSHYGTLRDWETKLLTIADLQQDKDAIRRITQKLAFENQFDKEYYHRWKSTFSELDWHDNLKNTIASIEQNVSDLPAERRNYTLLEKLGPLYVEEQMYSDLLDLVLIQTNFNIVLSYHKILCKVFPEKLVELYKKLLTRYADEVNDRSGYIKLMKLIKMIYNDVPPARKELTIMLITWKMIYYRRPAMIQEINSLLKKIDE